MRVCVAVLLCSLSCLGGSLQPDLLELSRIAQTDLTGAQTLAREWGYIVHQGKIVVSVESSFVSWPAHLRQYVTGTMPGLQELWVPIQLLQEVSRVQGVSYVRKPLTPVPCSTHTSEGVAVVGAPEWHASGFTGKGIKVAIIDVGFKGLKEVREAGKIRNVAQLKSYVPCNPEFGLDYDVHGTACAEVLSDMAPDATFYLWVVWTEVGLSEAVNDAIKLGIHIISHSCVWLLSNFQDGTGPICSTAQKAINAGIVWVNAAGNFAHGSHWRGSWVDTNNDRYLDFTSTSGRNSFSLPAGSQAVIWMTWNAFPSTTEDYDLVLIDLDQDKVVFRSEARQSRQSGPPIEGITIQTGKDSNFAIAVYSHMNRTYPDIEIYTTTNIRLEHFTSSTSIGVPGDVAGVVTVGAIDWKKWESGPAETWSSQGPTSAGLVKPDIVGPNRVKNISYSTTMSGTFGGTSAATPHVAGAAALVWQKFPEYTSQDIVTFLYSSAVDMGAPGKDNIYGHGRLKLGEAGSPGDQPEQPPLPPPSPDSHAHTYEPDGWTLVSAPVATPANVYKTTIYFWSGTEYIQISEVQAYYGYWARINTKTNVLTFGDVVPPKLPLFKGWNLISSAKPAVLGNIRFYKGETELTWDEAVVQGYISARLYGFKDGDFYIPESLDPWYGYWLFTTEADLSIGFSDEVASVRYRPLTTISDSIPLPPVPSMPILALYTGGMITFSLPHHDTAEISVYNLAGNLVWRSPHTNWDMKDSQGRYLANGVYLWNARYCVLGVCVNTTLQKLIVSR